MRKFVVVFIAVFVMFFVSFNIFAVSDEAKKHYETAKALYVAGDIDGAISELEKALSIDPSYEQARKLYEKIGGGKTKQSSEQVKSQDRSSVSQLYGYGNGEFSDSDKLKDNIKSVVSNLIIQIRSDIFVMISDVVKESFYDILKGDSYSVIKSEIKSRVKEIVKDIVENEINEAFSSLKVFSTNSYTNDIRIKDIKKSESDVKILPEFGSDSLDNDYYDRKKKAKELYSKAIEFLDEENYSEAMELLREASKLDPDNKEIMRSMQILSKIKQ